MDQAGTSLKTAGRLLVAPLRSLHRSDYMPFSRIVFRTVAGDLKIMQGGWRQGSDQSEENCIRSLGGCLRKQVDHQDPCQDQAKADQGGRIQPLFVDDPGDGGDQDKADP